MQYKNIKNKIKSVRKENCFSFKKSKKKDGLFQGDQPQNNPSWKEKLFYSDTGFSRKEDNTFMFFFEFFEENIKNFIMKKKCKKNKDCNRK